MAPKLRRLFFSSRNACANGKWCKNLASIFKTEGHCSNFRIIPLVYRVMDQMGPESPNFVESPEILQSIGHFVQHLIINFCSEDHLSTFLYACPNVHHLAIHLQITAAGTFALDRLLLGPQGMTRLTRLTVALSPLGFSRRDCQTRLNITHLDLFVPNRYPWEGQWEILAHLPKLTHLLIILRFIFEDDVVAKLLQFCQHLKILACMISHDGNVGNYDVLDTDDDRLVLLDGKKSRDWGRAPKWCVGAMFVSEHVVFARGSEYSFNFSVT